MKILLLQSVKNVGQKGDVVNAHDGYARNFLIPKKLGVLATEKAMHEKIADETKMAAMVRHLETLKEKIKKETLVLNIKTGKDGSVFGSVHAQDIEAALAARGYKNVVALLERPLKSLGDHKASLDFGHGIKGIVKIKIEPNN